MKYYYQHKDYLDVKLIAWFLSMILTGAFLGMLLREPNNDNLYRNRRGRRIELVEDEPENYLVEEFTN